LSVEASALSDDGVAVGSVQIPEITVAKPAEDKGNNGPGGGGGGSSVKPPEEETEEPEGGGSGTASRANPFRDVLESDWFYDDVVYVLANGLMNGTSATEFEPRSHMTRAMLVTVLHRLEGSPAPGGGGSFDDVASGQWYSDAVAWASEIGVVNGVGGGRFAPNVEISRQDLAVILTRYADAAGKQFPVTLQYVTFADENSIADYAKNAVQTLYTGGIVNGKQDNAFDPRGSATRAEVAAMLHRFIERTK
jgi:hypothetical protein